MKEKLKKAISTIESFGELEAFMIVASDGERVLNMGKGKLIKTISNSMVESKEFENLINDSIESVKKKRLMAALEPELKQLEARLKELQAEHPELKEIANQQAVS